MAKNLIIVLVLAIAAVGVYMVFSGRQAAPETETPPPGDLGAAGVQNADIEAAVMTALEAGDLETASPEETDPSLTNDTGEADGFADSLDENKF